MTSMKLLKHIVSVLAIGMSMTAFASPLQGIWHTKYHGKLEIKKGVLNMTCMQNSPAGWISGGNVVTKDFKVEDGMLKIAAKGSSIVHINFRVEDNGNKLVEAAPYPTSMAMGWFHGASCGYGLTSGNSNWHPQVFLRSLHN
jgi:hypothetical protein